MSLIESFNEAIDRLSNVLRQEKEQLLAGQYENLSQICSLKENLLAEIEKFFAHPDVAVALQHQSREIETMKRLSSENEKLLQATKAGVKSAQERLTHLKKIDSIVGTYTASGAQLRLDGSVTTCRKLA